VPIKELNRPFDVYVMLNNGTLEGIPRSVAHGDILNVRILEPVNAIRTYALWKAEHKKSLVVSGFRLDCEPGYPLGMVLLQEKFPSFWEKNHFLCPPFPGSKPVPAEVTLPASQSSPLEAEPESVASPEVYRKLKELAEKCGFTDVVEFAANAETIQSDIVFKITRRQGKGRVVRARSPKKKKFVEPGSPVGTKRNRFEAQLLAACLRSKDFCEKVAPVLCVDPAKPKKSFKRFSYPLDNLIYRLATMYRESSVGRTGPDIVPYAFFQGTARAMAFVGDLPQDEVPIFDRRVHALLSQPMEGSPPTLNSISAWVKMEARQSAPRASPTPQSPRKTRSRKSAKE
jgi:hypothetical protein